MSKVVNRRAGTPAGFMLLAFVLVWQLGVNPLSDQLSAEQSFEAYVEALQEGRQEEAKDFWNKEETQRHKTYDWQWAYLIYRMLDPRHLNYRITRTEATEDYVVLEVEWYYREGKAGPIQEDVRYFVRQEGKMVGANPIFVYTRDWLQQESKHFVYHYKQEEDRPVGALLEEMDQFYEKTVDLLGVSYQDKIDYFTSDSIEEVGRLFGMEPSLARSQPINGVVASIQRFVPHEVVHIISHRLLPTDEKTVPPEYLSEGLAYYLGGASFFSPELLLSWAKKKLEADGNVSLDSLMLNPWRFGKNEGAGLAASFAKFLMETKGSWGFKQLLASGARYGEQRQALEELYGRTVNELQAEWKEFVMSLPLPGVEIVDFPPAKETFYMEDPAGDDKGDGDYLYPKNERALPALFDLIGFEVSSDDALIYFRLRFGNLNDEKISSDEAFNGTFAVVAIDQDDRKSSGNTKLFFENGNVGFSASDAYEFVIEMSNAGVLVYDQDWVWHLLFLEASSQKNHLRGNEISFAIPQEIVGAPNSDWKYQVLTGGQKGGHKDAAYGVGKFMKVGQQPTQQQGGGGTDTDFSPDIYDILNLQGTNQVEILSSYDVTKKKKAIVPLTKLQRK
ncbi:MAG: hypothetical protein GTO24_19355 [candidate division Zixibacteria bacterium]|nr:hypothetical protein [candidate division Zixibacteria bacterium]